VKAKLKKSFLMPLKDMETLNGGLNTVKKNPPIIPNK